MADVDDVGQCRRKPEPRGMDHARDAAAAADIKVAQAKVRRGVRQQELLVAFEFGEQRIGGHFDYLASQGANAKGIAPSDAWAQCQLVKRTPARAGAMTALGIGSAD